ncbi:MAG: hypothetical protein ACRCZF_14995, partial [Gemmataceae bacterium]
ACCGLLELADRLWPESDAEGWFAPDGKEFYIHGHDRNENELVALLDQLLACNAATRLEMDTEIVEEDQPSEDDEDTEPSKVKAPKSDPVILGPPLCFVLNWWLRQDGSENLFKTWAANATSQQMFRKWRTPLMKLMSKVASTPEKIFDLTANIQGTYGFDSLLGWDRFDVGFSLNLHAKYKKVPTRPAVELLGAIGLQNFSPYLNERERTVTYATWHIPLLPNIARSVATGMIPDLATTVYCSEFVKRGTFKGLAFAQHLPEGESDE